MLQWVDFPSFRQYTLLSKWSDLMTWHIQNINIYNIDKITHTYPWVAKSHADSCVDNHTEVTLRLLHVQSKVSGQTHGNSWAEQQDKEQACERSCLHADNVISLLSIWHLQDEGRNGDHITIEWSVWSIYCCVLSSACECHLLQTLRGCDWLYWWLYIKPPSVILAAIFSPWEKRSPLS